MPAAFIHCSNRRCTVRTGGDKNVRVIRPDSSVFCANSSKFMSTENARWFQSVIRNPGKSSSRMARGGEERGSWHRGCKHRIELLRHPETAAREVFRRGCESK